VLTDAWEGVEEFLEPGREVLVASSAEEIARYLRDTSAEQAREIGRAARQRVLRDHTYDQRAAILEAAVRERLAAQVG
jgi:spore maturation protein CgeB